MKTLIIHHLEMTWQEGYKRLGTSFDELARKTISHIKRAKYDRVILTQFESWRPLGEHYESGLVEFIDKWVEYGYGWSLDDANDTDEESCHFVEGGNHSEMVMISDWMYSLRDDKVRICGAFDGECIEDLEIALNGCGVKFERVESLIV